ncbi:MAG: sporulation integral membrane protein YlbJ [Firmicutes bacterium]|nr:sporulation integral membrane protein YlbJ [Bacillota bacterium]
MSSTWVLWFWILNVLILTGTMIIYPQEVFTAAVGGLNTWLTIVFPALLPFFVMSELMVGLGFVHFLGVLLEPLMRPVFNLPGSGGFVVAMGYTSGFPVGAMLTARLRTARLCTQAEGERLVSFTNNASPLFIFVAVAVGMFHQPALGIWLAIVHYGINLLLGIALRFYRSREIEVKQCQPSENFSLQTAIKVMLEARRADGRAIGQLLGDAIRTAVNNLLAIGGFIIVFAVLIRLLAVIGLLHLFSQSFAWGLIQFGIPAELGNALATGFFEMTLGTKLASETPPPLVNAAIAGAILGWSGLAIHAQIAAMISHTDIRLRAFVLTRLLHAFFSGLLLYFILNHWSVLNPITPVLAPASVTRGCISLGGLLKWNLLLTTLVMGLMLVGAGACRSLQKK